MWWSIFGENYVRRVRSFGVALHSQVSNQKGSRFWRRFNKGSHFRADPNQNIERVHTFGESSQTVRTFGHGLAKA